MKKPVFIGGILLFFITFLLSFPNEANADLKKFFVIKVLDSSDEIIVEDNWGDKYLVEYGIGCLSMWRYEDEYIYIDTGLFLDGIGDTIYLFDSDDECRVWDAEEIDSSSSYHGGYYSAPAIPSCPVNSSLNSNGQCQCNAGYKANSSGDGCALNPSCPAHSHPSFFSYGTDQPAANYTCECDVNYHNSNGVCILTNRQISQRAYDAATYGCNVTPPLSESEKGDCVLYQANPDKFDWKIINSESSAVPAPVPSIADSKQGDGTFITAQNPLPKDNSVSLIKALKGNEGIGGNNQPSSTISSNEATSSGSLTQSKSGLWTDLVNLISKLNPLSWFRN